MGGGESEGIFADGLGNTGEIHILAYIFLQMGGVSAIWRGVGGCQPREDTLKRK